MEVKVNIVNMRCILVTEAVSVSNVIAIAGLVSEIWLATERQTDRHRHIHTQTDTVSVSSVKLAKVAYDFANKNRLTYQNAKQ